MYFVCIYVCVYIYIYIYITFCLKQIVIINGISRISYKNYKNIVEAILCKIVCSMRCEYTVLLINNISTACL